MVTVRWLVHHPKTPQTQTFCLTRAVIIRATPRYLLCSKMASRIQNFWSLISDFQRLTAWSQWLALVAGFINVYVFVLWRRIPALYPGGTEWRGFKDFQSSSFLFFFHCHIKCYCGCSIVLNTHRVNNRPFANHKYTDLQPARSLQYDWVLPVIKC